MHLMHSRYAKLIVVALESLSGKLESLERIGKDSPIAGTGKLLQKYHICRESNVSESIGLLPLTANHKNVTEIKCYLTGPLRIGYTEESGRILTFRKLNVRANLTQECDTPPVEIMGHSP